MSSEQAALYAAVVASPDDDLPRLVYADWLEEHGESERAEFIRVQCRMANSTPADPDHFDLCERHLELSAILKHQLEKERPKLPAGFDWEEEKRGFPYRVTCSGNPRSLARVEQQLDRIATLAPVRGLWAASGLSDKIGFVRRPSMGRFEHLFVDPGGGFDMAGFVDALVGSDHVGRLRDLQFPFERFDDASFAVFCRAETLSQLTRFYSGWDHLSPRANAALRTAVWRESLEKLEMFGGQAFPAVAAGVSLPRLHTLFLFDSDLSPALAGVLNDTALLPRLAEFTALGDQYDPPAARGTMGPITRPLAALGLRNVNLGPRGVRRQLESPTAEGLRLLTLDAVHTCDDWLADLTRASLPALRVLKLTAGTLTGESLSTLARAAVWSHLTEFELCPYKAELTAKDWVRFFAGWHAPRLRRLYLRGTRLQERGVKALLANPTLVSVRSLTLWDCGIGEKAARALFAAPQLRHLTVLDLLHNRIGNAPEVLTDPGVLPHARLINLGEVKVTPAVARKLRTRPEVRFTVK